MPKVYFSLGTNLGNKEENLRNAVNEINKRVGKVTSLSAFYVTEPWGFKSDNMFVNAAVEVETPLNPFELLKETQYIEKDMGRKHKSVDKAYTDRIIDIDILLYDDLIIQESNLVLPHPLMTEREFVMVPLTQIAPQLLHPVYGRTMSELLDSLS